MSENDDADDDDTEMHYYRSEIEQEIWDEFKKYTPRHITLQDQLNNLVREYVRQQRAVWDQIEEQTGHRPGDVGSIDLVQTPSIADPDSEAADEDEDDERDNGTEQNTNTNSD